ncbi:MAG: hypothetical protein M1829_003979 [Trizodia sp. TS-e1964]|nr:MAG: hypothetical protein M1829_003979 [Trizodia sp. TS-e1964]
MNTPQPPSVAPTPAPHTTCYDPLDIDSFINYDPVVYPSPSLSTASARSRPSLASINTLNPNNTLLPPSSSQQTFSGPSHRYDSYKQQTGIPAGSLANLVANQPPVASQFARGGFGAPNDGYFSGLGLSEEDFVDFSSADNTQSFGTDMELDFDPPEHAGLSPFFFPDGPMASQEFVDPSSLTAHDGQRVQPTVVASTSNGGRLYPGVHQEQAALAKAQQQQQQKQQVQRKQPGTLPSQQPPRSAKSAAHQKADPIVEEKISQLLKSMRQSSVTSSADEEGESNNGNTLSHVGRMKKDEEDMDEDERLLASEEGKKLSSKERRQLRNKVSARAFRSRRKEYIGQLEAELAAKSNEANDYKNRLVAMEQENARLTDLTKMLLSSSAFSNFMDNLSVAGAPSAAPATTKATPEEPHVSTPIASQTATITRKDVNPYSVIQPTHMAILPDHQIDFSMIDQSNSWAAGPIANGAWGTNQQVFSVMEVPEGPAANVIESDILSGKSGESAYSRCSRNECKQELPTIERMPVPSDFEESSAKPAQVVEADFDTSDPALALYLDSPTSVPVKQIDMEGHALIFGDIQIEKALSRLELTSDAASETDGQVSAATMDQFQRICFNLEAAFERIGRATSHI